MGEDYDLDAQDFGVTGEQGFDLAGIMERKPRMDSACIRIVLRYQEMRASVVAVDDSVPERLAGASHAHGQRQ